MAARRYEIDTRMVTVFFLAAMPFVAFGSFVVVNMARGSLERSVGESLEQRATETRLLLERYLGEQTVDLRLVALDPDVRRALEGPSRPATAETASQRTTSPLAARLRDVVQMRPAWQSLQLIDSNGRVLATTIHAGRLLYEDAAWFQKLAELGTGGQIYLSDALAPGSAMRALEIAYPIRASDGRLLGAFHALIDVQDLYGVLAPVRIGKTGHAVLVRAADGLVLASDDSAAVLRRPYAGFASLHAAVQGFPLGEQGELVFGKADQSRGYWRLPEVRESGASERLVEPARLVGFAPVESPPNVQWLVIVEQDLSEALSPVTGVTRYLWIHFVGVFGTVILLALALSISAESPVIDQKLHLHEEHMPKDMVAHHG